MVAILVVGVQIDTGCQFLPPKPTKIREIRKILEMMFKEGTLPKTPEMVVEKPS